MQYRQLTIAVVSAALLGFGATSGAAGSASNAARVEAMARRSSGPIAYVVMDGSNSIAVVDLDKRKIIDRIAVGGNPHGGAITPDGRYIYTASMGANNIHVVDTKARSVKDTIEIGSITHHSVASPDGKYIYTAANEVVVIDVAANRVVARIATEEPPFDLALSPDGSRLYALGVGSPGKGSSIAVIDPVARRTVATIPMTGTSRMGHLAFGPDGRELFVTNDLTDTVSVVDVATRREVARVQVGKGPHAIAVTNDGRRVIVANRGRTDLSVIDVRSRKVVATREVGQRPEHLTLSPDGRFLLLSRDTGANQILMLDPATLKTIAAIDVWRAPHVILLAKRRPK